MKYQRLSNELMENSPQQTNEQQDPALQVAKEKTRDSAKKLWDIIAKYSRIDTIGEQSTKVGKSAKKHQFHNSGLLFALSIVPYFLSALFILSFFWDFDNISWQVFGYTLQVQGLLKILSVSGLIGFLTNWLAITMLFKPAKKRPILGHGLVPAQKDRIAYRLAQAVSEDLINPEIIKKRIHESNIIAKYREQTTAYIKTVIDDPDFRTDLKDWVVDYVHDMVADAEIRGAIAKKIIINIEDALEDKSIEKVALKAYSYIKGQEMQYIIEEALTKLPSSVESGLDKFDGVLDTLPSKINKHSVKIEDIVTNLLYKLVNQLDVHALVEDNLKEYDEQHISQILQNATNEQLRYIQYLGAVLGMIGGFVIWEPLLSIIAIALILSLLLSLDNLLVRRTNFS
ncbi:MAG: DUF445 family protein [Balneolaceae bacterium]|nr:DUF445 family protein [Balneolaceae bacterium]